LPNALALLAAQQPPQNLAFGERAKYLEVARMVDESD
jgi:hypothetical protein